MQTSLHAYRFYNERRRAPVTTSHAAASLTYGSQILIWHCSA